MLSHTYATIFIGRLYTVFWQTSSHQDNISIHEHRWLLFNCVYLFGPFKSDPGGSDDSCIQGWAMLTEVRSQTIDSSMRDCNMSPLTEQSMIRLQ
jgi:hypothetical protein